MTRYIQLRLSKQLWKQAFREKKALDLNWEEYFKYIFFGRKKTWK